MSNVQQIKSFLSNFTPEGQKMALGIMRANKKMLTSPKGIASLFEKLSKTGEVAKLEQYLPCRLDTVVLGTMQNSFVGKKFSFEQLKACAENMWKMQSKLYIKNTADMVTDDIVTKKDEIIKIVKSILPNHKMVNNLEKAKTKEEIIEILQSFYSNFDTTLQNTIGSMMKESGMKITFSKKGYRELPLEVLQEIYKKKENYGEALLKLYKLINPVSTNPEIIKIEKILTSKYGFEYAHFSDLEEARSFLQAVKIHIKEGTPLPKAVSTSCLRPNYSGEHIQATNGNFVIINPYEKLNAYRQDCYNSIENPYIREYIKSTDAVNRKRHLSTNKNDSLHVAVHEIEHSNGLGYGKLPIDKQLVTVKYRNGKPYFVCHANPNTAKKLGGYAEQGIQGLNEEIRTELRTKKILEPQNFTDDEQKLLDFWS